MSISLKNIDDRVRALESKINTGKFTDTGWINGTFIQSLVTIESMVQRNLELKYRCLNGVVFLYLNCVLKTYNTTGVKFGKFDNWTYGEMLFASTGGGHEGGSFEGSAIKILSDGSVIDASTGSQWRIYNAVMGVTPINLYYKFIDFVHSILNCESEVKHYVNLA